MEREDVRAQGLLIAETIKAELLSMLDEEDEIAMEFRSAVGRGDIKDFKSLHFIMDANMLGNSASVFGLEITPVDADRIQANAQMTSDEAVTQTRMDVLNAAQDEVDRWIKAGGLHKGMPDTGPWCALDTYDSYAEALKECASRNKMVAGPDGGVTARSSLAVIVDGPGDDQWTVMEVRDAIEEEFEWRWVN